MNCFTLTPLKSYDAGLYFTLTWFLLLSCNDRLTLMEIIVEPFKIHPKVVNIIPRVCSKSTIGIYPWCAKYLWGDVAECYPRFERLKGPPNPNFSILPSPSGVLHSAMYILQALSLPCPVTASPNAIFLDRSSTVYTRVVL